MVRGVLTATASASNRCRESQPRFSQAGAHCLAALRDRRRLGGSIRVLLLMACLALVAPSAAVAAPPANDDFDSATVIGSFPFSDSLNTTEATTASDDPFCAGNGPTVWYSFTPPSDVSLDANTFGSDYDTTISVYTGSRDSLTEVACNDDVGRAAVTGHLERHRRADLLHQGRIVLRRPRGNLQLTLQEAPPAP